MAAFELSKWYLDCMDDAGDVRIAYAAHARWGPIRLNYSSLLESAGEVVRVRHSVHPYGEPESLPGLVRWSSEALNVEDADAALFDPRQRFPRLTNDPALALRLFRLPRLWSLGHRQHRFAICGRGLPRRTTSAAAPSLRPSWAGPAWLAAAAMGIDVPGSKRPLASLT